jgi:hypothetical protein
MKVLSATTSDGATVMFEVDPQTLERAAGAPRLAGQAAGAGDATVEHLRDAAGAIVTVCRDVRGRVQDGFLDDSPDEFQLEFGVIFAGEAGLAVITNASAQATLRVTATSRSDGS